MPVGMGFANLPDFSLMAVIAMPEDSTFTMATVGRT
jgi:hypothetical protein